MLDKLTSADFMPALRQTFQLYVGPWGQPHDPAAHEAARSVELIEVASLVPGSSNARSFSIVFREAGPAYLPQRIYTIEHAALGRLDLFLVPIGPDAVGMRYQAIFN